MARCAVTGDIFTVSVRGVVIPPDELSWRFSRSPGPGGQSVNTTESRVELSYDLAGSDALFPALKERALRALAGAGQRRGHGDCVRAPLAASQPAGGRAPDVGAADRGHGAATAAAPPDQAEPRGARTAARGQAAPFPGQADAPGHRRLARTSTLGRSSSPGPGRPRRGPSVPPHPLVSSASFLTVFQLRDVAVTPSRFSRKLLVSLVSAAPTGHHRNASVPLIQI